MTKSPALIIICQVFTWLLVSPSFGDTRPISGGCWNVKDHGVEAAVGRFLLSEKYLDEITHCDGEDCVLKITFEGRKVLEISDDEFRTSQVCVSYQTTTSRGKSPCGGHEIGSVTFLFRDRSVSKPTASLFLDAATDGHFDMKACFGAELPQTYIEESSVSVFFSFGARLKVEVPFD